MAEAVKDKGDWEVDMKQKGQFTLVYFGGEIPAEKYLRKELKDIPCLGVLLTFFSLQGENSVARRRLRALLKERKKRK